MQTSATLEHSNISVSLTESIYKQFAKALEQNDTVNIINYLRMMSSSQAIGIIKNAIADIFASSNVLTLDVVLTITGRCWHVLEDHIVALMEYVANHQEHTIFVGIFADLVAIPQLRPHMLGMIRMQNRSEALSRAIGKLFQQG